MSVIEIIDTALKQLPYPVEWRVTQSYPTLDFQIQAVETTHGFIKRLSEEFGLNWHFEHRDGSHTLVISDSLTAFKPMDSAAYHIIPYYPSDTRTQEEFVHTFTPAQRLVSGQVSLTDYQFKEPTADQTVTAHQPWTTAHSELEVYEWQRRLSDGSGWRAV